MRLAIRGGPLPARLTSLHPRGAGCLETSIEIMKYASPRPLLHRRQRRRPPPAACTRADTPTHAHYPLPPAQTPVRSTVAPPVRVPKPTLVLPNVPPRTPCPHKPPNPTQHTAENTIKCDLHFFR
ncbi:hypothetical protein HYPSUDRAFT_49405 [Hypholoma sublateritium FD-334 SS-4]|uniref:Uncharacterized protein n=1 Tax=Hypholoma sublateritium (strain FD-334 SS-4) TaxID=945553 RepID=A0A0D2LTM4_HYPSF|nr:hypothetical protein HYPSUDRAFT_49405 [Hypholoma sublateritium FD-334 SS-4]